MQIWLIVIWKNFVHHKILRIWSNNPLASKILIIQHCWTHFTNYPKSFHSSSVYQTGLSDFHKLTLTVLKTFHIKHKYKTIQYGDFNHFDNALFQTDLLLELSLKIVLPGEFEKYKYISSKVLNIHAPLREKHIRCNQSPFTSKQLIKAIMTWNCLLNK